MRHTNLPTAVELVSLVRSVVTAVPTVVTAAQHPSEITWSLAAASVAVAVDKFVKVVKRPRPPS